MSMRAGGDQRYQSKNPEGSISSVGACGLQVGATCHSSEVSE